MAHLSPTTLTTDEQRLILRATAGNIRDHIIYSLALGTGLRLAEIVGLDVGDVKRPTHRRRGVPSHRFDPLNKCGLFITTSRAASRISMVIVRLPTSR